MRFFSIFILSLFFCGGVVAQSLTFDKTTINFGTIKEVDGKVKGSFEFTNTSKRPFIINYVSTGCGCTGATYDKAPIRPNESRTIEVEFDPKWRSGLFRTDVTLVAASPQERYELVVIGNIIPSRESVLDMFPFAVGDKLRVSSTKIALGAVPNDSTYSDFISIFNLSDKSITIEARSRRKGSRAWVKNAHLKSNQKGFLLYEVSLESNLVGEITDQIEILVDGVPIKQKIEVTAIVTPNFNNMTQEQIDKAPDLFLNRNIRALGELTSTRPVSYSFEIENMGGGELEILDFVRRDSSLEVAKNFDSLRKGQSGKITLTLHPERFEQAVNARVTMITNSPYTPVKVLTITANK